MIYLDNNATTRPFAEVIEAMSNCMASHYWNASSAYGQMDGLEEVIESAKTAIIRLIGGEPEDNVVFTSGATESNVWAVTEGFRRSTNRGWLLSSQIEHPSIRIPLEHLQAQGIKVCWTPVTRDGVIDLGKIAEIIDSQLGFVSLMLAHNETGVIQPIKEATTLIRAHAPECLIHTDATQAIGKIPISLSDELSEVDLISFSGHKFHGPKGIGGLIIRNGTSLQPLIRGGGQQQNMRSGTMNIPAIAGISVAASKCRELLQKNQHISVQLIRDEFEELMRSRFPNIFILGKQAPRLPNTSFWGMSGIDADDFVYTMAANGIVIGKGSACSAQSIKPSHMATLMGYSHEDASSLIRISSSFNTNLNELVKIADKIIL